MILHDLCGRMSCWIRKVIFLGIGGVFYLSVFETEFVLVSTRAGHSGIYNGVCVLGGAVSPHLLKLSTDMNWTPGRSKIYYV